MDGGRAVSAEPTRNRFPQRVLWIAAALAVGLAAKLDWTSPDSGAPTSASTAAAPQPDVHALAASAHTPVQVHSAAPQRHSAPAEADLPQDSELDGHPHPITSEHVRIQRELQLIQQLNDALDLRDAPQLRALIAQYAQSVPGDPNALAAGYERIADCLEHPGAQTRDRAREYYARERASTLRRYVRRVCFDDEPVEAAKL
jgi:hypothetical protein